MKRPEFIALLSGTCAFRPLAARAQGPRRRIAWLGWASNPSTQGAFIERMRQLGNREGRDYEIDFRFADGEVTRFAALAQELVALKPDVIVAGNAAAALADPAPRP